MAALTPLVLRQYSPTIYKPDGTAHTTKEELTPLAKHIRDTILATGPISIASYMQLALTSPIGGYYTRGQVFGREGDFVTSPEISQMFGEIMAVWYAMHWETMGRPAKTSFVELGPGRGTLMNDIMRASKRFKAFYASIQGIHFIEKSPELRRLQHDKLGCDWNDTTATSDKNSPGIPASGTSKSHNGLRISWYDLLEEIAVEQDCVPLVMAHEFFDALPIYKFEKSEGGKWSEILVDVAESTSIPTDPVSSSAKPSTSHFKYVRARGVTSNAALIMRDQRFGALFDKGDHVEISPESARIMIQLAEWISSKSGMGLIIDYGVDWTQGNTFRGIKNHRFSDPLSSPGSMDLTADVDFSYLRYAANGKARCFGPIEQGEFLHSMGIQARLQQLLHSTSDAKVQKDLVDCYKRLTDVHSMGRVYKVLAVLPAETAMTPVPFASAAAKEGS
ncbi:hypothetical protein GGI04_004346 [Coemansia thaxteri]|uniref:Protein arginine methyltransferase NDUFAF7 n=1 Tax=Coemansia thaxteri TaxID=2663907 RepID=A0A9W8BAL5_9FUNG|nr:hypothetical protein GGI04_004346 [Coemansia thaxteri]KAJ2000359.1 hypothetical protein H4R26_004655 [Coemansia thaxteri]KAJ2467115.1 hypothetical protein GGI02_004143 [Coemansia sp. RSA 2322]KAJ2484224.1 hypothetical protein EV174_002606 [Coemansia sp. RSA 2320]